MNLAKYIDHTLLKPTATPAQIEKLCQEARDYQFATVCVNPWHVARAAKSLAGSGVGVTTVVGFPLGANKTDIKVKESELALEDGATEIDMVINIGAMLAGEYAVVEQDIAAVAKVVANAGVLKVIIETAYLNNEQITTVSKITRAAGAQYVKTSTGFAGAGAKVEHVQLMRAAVGHGFGIKAAGGIGDRATAMAMIDAGATRLGASSGVAIVSGREGADSY